jgi:hypothetical protein
MKKPYEKPAIESENVSYNILAGCSIPMGTDLEYVGGLSLVAGDSCTCDASDYNSS